MRADVNVFDPLKVAECQPELANDFPCGEPRFIQRSVGYKATIVNAKGNGARRRAYGRSCGSSCCAMEIDRRSEMDLAVGDALMALHATLLLRIYPDPKSLILEIFPRWHRGCS
jgi:hypothetical protein